VSRARIALLVLALVVAGGVTAAVALSAGGDPDPKATAPQLIDGAQRDKTPPGSPERVLSDYWSSLQFNDWAAAVSQFAPSYLNYIGPQLVVAGLQVDASFYPTTRPRLVEVVRRGKQAAVRYSVTAPGRPSQRETLTLVRDPQGWRIIYDSALDNRFRSAQQAAAGSPARADGKQSSKALRAGETAARLQAGYLQARRQLAAQSKARARRRASTPRPRSSAVTPGRALPPNAGGSQ